MNRLIACDLDDATVPWSEDDMQMAVVRELRRAGIVFAADQNAGRRSKQDGARRKALGMQAGETDIRLYFLNGRIVHVEMKAPKGTTSKEQKHWHAVLRSIGHDVYVIREKTPAAAVNRILEIVERHK